MPKDVDVIYPTGEKVLDVFVTTIMRGIFKERCPREPLPRFAPFRDMILPKIRRSKFNIDPEDLRDADLSDLTLWLSKGSFFYTKEGYFWTGIR
jgi:hypothetical protein